MSHRGSGKSAGERQMGDMTKTMTAKMSLYSQSKGGNGGKSAKG